MTLTQKTFLKLKNFFVLQTNFVCKQVKIVELLTITENHIKVTTLILQKESIGSKKLEYL